MAGSIPHKRVKPIGSYNDPFGDGAYDEPFNTNLNHDDTKTFTTYTSGVPAEDPTRTIQLAGPTEAEFLAADYRQHNTSPSLLDRPDRLPTPHFLNNNTLPNPADTTMNAPYRDDDWSSSPRPLSVGGKPDISLVQNAADMDRSSGYQHLGMHPTGGICVVKFICCAEYAEPSGNGSKSVSEKDTPLGAFLGTGKYPIEQRIEDKRRGIGRQRHPFVGVLTSRLKCCHVETVQYMPSPSSWRVCSSTNLW